MIDLSHKMLQDLDVIAEFNPPELLQQIENYNRDDFSGQDWNRLQYFRGKALLIMHRVTETEEIAITCIQKAIVERDYYVLVRCYALQSMCYYRSELEDRIKPLLEMALEYAEQSGEFELIIYANSEWLHFLAHMNLHNIAFPIAERVVDLVERSPASYITIYALRGVASLHKDMSQWDLSIKYLMQALEQAQLLELYDYQLTILNNLGTAVSNIQDYAKAERIFRQGLDLSQKVGFVRQEILFNSNLGCLKITASKHKEAITYYDKCIELLESISQPPPPPLLIDIYNNYSLCYWRLKQHDKALYYINQAIEIAKSSNFPRDKVQMEINKTNLLVDVGDYAEALTEVKKGIQFYKKSKDLHQLIWTHRLMSHIYYLMKDFKRSYDTNRKLDKITDDYIAEIQRDEAKEESQKITSQTANSIDFHHTTTTSFTTSMSEGFIGCSKSHQHILNSALLAAQHQNTSVLILGESGTGKEVIAQMIHRNSVRRNQAFVPVNVAALSSTLVESELFGHTKGAFTGADTQTKGFFLQADKGTLFLDEITDMPIAVQSKLLRALETRKVTAVGSSREVPFDSRIIAATSQDIRTQLTINQFRLDLFHRLNTIEIVIPPLRDRQDDIEPIFKHYVHHYSKELKKPIPIIDKSLLDVLISYAFPGNVRELKNIVERMYILSKARQWDAQILCEINPFSFATDDINQLPEENEEDIILKALIKAKGKQKEAAKLLNMSEATLYRRIVKYQLQIHTRKQGNK